MSFRRHVLGLSMLIACAVPLSCAVRLGRDENKAQPDGGGADPNGKGGANLGSACSRVGDEVKVPTPKGTETFSLRWDNDHYLLAFSDGASGNGDIATMTLGPDGKPTSGQTIVASTAAFSDLPNLLRTDDGWIVTWQEGTAGRSVLAQKLDPSGRPSGSTVNVGTTDSPEARPVPSKAPGGYAIAWMDGVLGTPNVQLAYLDQNLAVKSGPKRVAEKSSGAGFPWIVGDDKKLGLLWSDKREGQFDTRFAFVDEAMSMSNDVPLRSDAVGDALLGRMIKTDFGYLGTWEDRRLDDNQIFMALLDHEGRKIAGGLVQEPETGDANWSNMAWTGTSAGVVYYQWRGANPQIFISFIDANGKRVRGLRDFQVSSTPKGSMARFPDVQWTGSEFGVMWVDTRESSPQLYFARVSCKQ